MKTRPRGPLFALALAGALLWHAASTRAAHATGRDSYQVALLDLETEGVNDRFAGELSQRLRAALSARPDYALRPTQVSLQQLSLAQNCALTEASCLTSITRSMQLDGLVFGSVTHDGGAPVAMLRRFDLKSAAVVRTSLVTFSSRDAPPSELDAAAERLLNDVLTAESSVRATPLPAEPATEVDAAGDSEPTRAALGGALSSSTKTSESQSIVRPLAGWTLVGLAVASGGMAAFSAYQVQRAKSDDDFKNYRSAVGEMNQQANDVCAEADKGMSYGLTPGAFRNAKNSCRNGSTFEILQYVFLGGAVVTGAVGTYLLLSGGGKERDTRQTSRLQLRPNVGRTQLGLDAALRF